MRKILSAVLIAAAAGTSSAAPQGIVDHSSVTLLGPSHAVAAPLDSVTVDRSADVRFSNMGAGGGYAAYGAATGVIGWDDYISVATGSLDLTVVKFIGGVVNANEILWFDYFDYAGANWINGFGVQLPQGGNFIWTITLGSPVTVDPTGILQITADTASGSMGQWYLSDALATVGTQDPNFGYAPPPYSAKFELRALPTVSGPYCFGDGKDVACPCGNNGAGGTGCVNSTGVGASLTGSGTADVAADTFVLSAAGMPANATALFFQGNVMASGGIGMTFGDGLRCTVGGIKRLETVMASGSGDAATSLLLSVKGGLASGSVVGYQCWYRDTTGPCGTLSNTTNAWLQTWQ